MKKLIALFSLIALICFMLCACKGAPQDSAEPVDIAATPTAEVTPGDVVYGHSAGVEITSTAAYVFEGARGLTLYGAIEYKNTGDCPIYISKASLVFDASGNVTNYEHVPALGEYTIVLPGDTSFEAVWVDAPASLSAGDEVALRGALTAVEAAAPRVALEVGKLYTADNYPGFSTLSGTLGCTSETGCSMNMIYVGFYDEAGAFIGAWYFSKNAVLEHGDEKNFVVNMRDFPFADMGARTASYKAAAFGFEL